MKNGRMEKIKIAIVALALVMALAVFTPVSAASDDGLPSVTITSPHDNTVTNAESVTVEGTVTAGTLKIHRVIVLNVSMRIQKEASLVNGSFSVAIPLREGINLIGTDVIDIAGNISGESRIVIRSAQTTGSPPEIKKIGIAPGETRGEASFENSPVVKLDLITSTGDIYTFVRQLDKLTGITEPQAKVFSYLEMEIGAEAQIRNITIRFRVPKLWMAQNAVDETTIRLLRYVDNKWEELPTRYIEGDAEYAYLTAETAGFSIFAIASVPQAWYTQPLNLALIALAIVVVIGTAYWFRFWK